MEPTGPKPTEKYYHGKQFGPDNNPGLIEGLVDDEGVSWVVIDDEAWERATMQEWIGGIPDLWKRR